MHILRPRVHRYAPPLHHAFGHRNSNFIGFRFNSPGPVVCCRGLELSVPYHDGGYANAAFPVDWNKLANLAEEDVKCFDVAAFGNLCVDIVLSVPELPPPCREARLAYRKSLASQPPDKRFWEAGGNCNMTIAASRLGLQCTTIGHVGDEIYGDFLLEVLREEGIKMSRMVGADAGHAAAGDGATPSLYETLLCWVLVDPMQRHGFCSVADFTKEPAFSWIRTLTDEMKCAIKQSKIVFFNGFGFDELPPSVLVSALDYAKEVNTLVFFDPGPRGKSLSMGTAEEQRALDHFSKMSDVLLLTSEEAESLTGIAHPILAGKELLRRGVRTKWVIVKMGDRGSILIDDTSVSCVPSFAVSVADTVGCGDSFVAAVAYGYLHEMPLLHTLAVANAVGAATAMGCGAGRNVASLDNVIRILRASNFRQDDDFWIRLFEPIDAKETIYLAGSSVNDCGGLFHRVPMKNVVDDLLPKLELIFSHSN